MSISKYEHCTWSCARAWLNLKLYLKQTFAGTSTRRRNSTTTSWAALPGLDLESSIYTGRWGGKRWTDRRWMGGRGHEGNPGMSVSFCDIGIFSGAAAQEAQRRGQWCIPGDQTLSAKPNQTKHLEYMFYWQNLNRIESFCLFLLLPWSPTKH